MFGSIDRLSEQKVFFLKYPCSEIFAFINEEFLFIFHFPRFLLLQYTDNKEIGPEFWDSFFFFILKYCSLIKGNKKKRKLRFYLLLRLFSCNASGEILDYAKLRKTKLQYFQGLNSSEFLCVGVWIHGSYNVSSELAEEKNITLKRLIHYNLIILLFFFSNCFFQNVWYSKVKKKNGN